MEAPMSASQGAMRSLPGKLETLLLGSKYGLREEDKNKIRILQGDLQGVIDNYLMEPSEVESPALTANFWMNDVRDLSFDVDDFVDEVAYVGGAGARISAVRETSRVKISRFRGKQKRRQWIADEISGFRARVKDAIQRHRDYLGDCKLRPSSSSASDERRAPPPPPYGETGLRLVGMESSIKQLSSWLADDGQPERKVASIVGTGGVGKTTLAKELYRKLGGQFECRAFVRTSQKPDMRRLLTSILSQVRRRRHPVDAYEVHKLVSEINAHLKDKTYFIVIDDVWASSRWDMFNRTLPKGNCCSRVLTTTEVDVVARTCCADNSKYIFRKEPLSEDESRELFSSRVFGHQSECPQHLKEVSYEIIKRSGGLPLTVFTLASLLARQPTSIEQWNYIKNSLTSEFITSASLEGIKQVLSLCYDNLPHLMKACMLYLSLYEEDSVIWKDDLVKQWIAEAFVGAMEGSDEEEVARSYFDELVNRGMIQPVDTNDCNDEVLSCTVHHMVLHFIRYKSIEENFSISIDHSQTTIRLAGKVRRLALHFGNVEDATQPASMGLSQVRSLAFSGLLKCMPSIVEFRFLQVLILKLWANPDNQSDNLAGSDGPGGNLIEPDDLSCNLTEPDDLSCNLTEPDDLSDNHTEPDDLNYNLTEISELFRLKYLRVDACHVSVELPTQMKRLKYLVALEIDAEVYAVPSDIVDLPGLLYLSLPSEAHLPTNIGRMTSLRTLRFFDLSKNSTENVMGLGELTNLQDLHLTCSTLQADNLEKNLECLGSIIGKLSSLKCLTLVPAGSSHANTQDASASSMIIPCDGFSIVPLPLALLQRLELSRRCCIFSSLPEWTKEFAKLSILKIAVRKLSSKDIDILKRLPILNALSLYVWTAPIGRIIFGSEGFPGLESFKFVCSAPCVAFLEGAMPNVRKLKIGFNAKRMERYSLVAASFEHLTGLNEISIKIGGASADEPDRRSTESVLRDAISKHPRIPIINVQWVDSNFYGDVEEKNVEAQEEIYQTSEKQDVVTEERSDEHAIQEKKLGKAANKQADKRTYALPESTSHLQSTELLGKLDGKTKNKVKEVVVDEGTRSGRTVSEQHAVDKAIGRAEIKNLEAPGSRSSRVVGALSKAQLLDGYVSYPWEKKMREVLPVPNSSCSLSMLVLPTALDHANSRYNSVDDTLSRANAWFLSSQASGVPIAFLNVQTEALLTKISGDLASATVNSGSLADLPNLANASLNGFEDDHGVDIGVVKAVHLWYTAAAGEMPVEITLEEGDTKLGFAISRTEEGFIYISSVIEDDGDCPAPSTRSGLRDLYREAKSASKLLVISRVSCHKVLPWMVSTSGAIRCFDILSLGQKLSLHRHALRPILIHVLMWSGSSDVPARPNGPSPTPQPSPAFAELLQQNSFAWVDQPELPQQNSFAWVDQPELPQQNSFAWVDQPVQGEGGEPGIMQGRDTAGDASFRFHNFSLPYIWV